LEYGDRVGTAIGVDKEAVRRHQVGAGERHDESEAKRKGPAEDRWQNKIGEV